MSGNSTGSGATGMRFPEDPTYDPVDNWLFVPDTGNNRILVFNLNNGITDGMPAWHVLGQNSFSGTGPDYQGSVTAAGMDNPYGGIAYDTTHHLLFVGDANNGRVLVFDLSNGITDGMPATYVIGQSSTTATGCSAISATSMGTPYGIAYDAEHNRLFVGDDGTCVSNTIEMSRVGIYNLNNLATGMAASFELGQPDLNTGGDLSPAANVINSPEDVIYDPANQQLFVQDDEYNRILVFDVASVSNFENAVAVIGQPNFTSDDYSCNPSQTDQCDAEGVNDAFDPVNNRLYLSDADDDRVLVFNFINVTTPAGSLKTATAGTSYSQAFQTINSQGTVSFAGTSGSLPPGLSLNTTTGVISGTPTTTGTYTFELTAYDNNGAIGTFEDDPSYSITVNPSIPDTGYGQPINNHTITYLAIISVLSTGLGLGLASRRRLGS